MAEENKTITPPNLPPGVKLRHTLRGHTGFIGRIAWSPDGRMIASPSEKQTIRLWDTETGKLFRTLEGHLGTVYVVAFDPSGRMLASGGSDAKIKLWNPTSGRLLCSLERHRDAVYCVAFNPSGRILASGSSDKTIKLWDPTRGKLLRTLEGHFDKVFSLAFDPSGRTLISVSRNETIKWEVSSGNLVRTIGEHGGTVFSIAFHPSGRLVASGGEDTTIKVRPSIGGARRRTLEGHISVVACVGFSADGHLLASRSDAADNTVRLWRSDTWEPVAVIPELASIYWPPGLAFHPNLPLLATVGSDPDTPEDKRDRLIHIWELDLEILFDKTKAAKAAPRAVHHTTAKIVLVGDSGVGKTGLGWRLAHGEYKDHSSTHGQQFWVLNQLSKRRSDGTECEAILWDLAGQPDYRLIHALFLDDADLALVLFDPTDSRDPLHGVEFWLKQLKAA